MEDWVVEDSLKTLRQAADRLRRASNVIEKNADVFADGKISLAEAMAFSANEIANTMLNLRLDKFVTCTARAGKDAMTIRGAFTPGDLI